MNARWLTPKKGATLVDVLCEKSEPRIANVRYLRDVGLVLWYRADSGDVPERATPIDELPEHAIAWCPVCGPMPIDVGALTTVARDALRTHKRLKFTV